MEAINNQNNIATNTLVATGIGAGINAGFNIIQQRGIMKGKDTFMKVGEDLKNLNAGSIKSFLYNNEEVVKGSALYKKLVNAVKIAETGKMNVKQIVKTGALGAAIVGGITLIASLLKSKKSEK